MDIIEKIKKLASDGVDMALQTFSSDRIGAEAERRKLFEAWMRNASDETLANLLRERHMLCAQLTDDELRRAFRKRELRDETSYEAGAEDAGAAYRQLIVLERRETITRIRALNTFPLDGVTIAIENLCKWLFEQK